MTSFRLATPQLWRGAMKISEQEFAASNRSSKITPPSEAWHHRPLDEWERSLNSYTHILGTKLPVFPTYCLERRRSFQTSYIEHDRLHIYASTTQGTRIPLDIVPVAPHSTVLGLVEDHELTSSRLCHRGTTTVRSCGHGGWIGVVHGPF